MERVDTNHTYFEGPKPILTNSHTPRKSISGMDFLSGLKIITNSDIFPTPTASSPHTPITEHHISEQIEDFDIKGPIGYGSSAIVYKAIIKSTNKPVALKMIDLDKFERNQIDELRRETSLMALCKHPNVLRVYGSFVHGSKLYIVTPYLSGGSCLDIMKNGFPEGLDELGIATILKQALEAMVYLHKNGHIHRDIKAGNLLMDDDGTVLLGDFGVSSSLMETGERGMRKTFVGTPCWMAPEVMEQQEYDYKADIWSFGITAIELATGHAPFAKHTPAKVLILTINNDPPVLERETGTHKYSKSFQDMVSTCLVKDPLKRPTAEKLLGHSFFKQAKKKEYLVKSILADIPPLEQRPRKKIFQKQTSITKLDPAWNFDEDPQIQVNQKPDLPKRCISFGDAIIYKNSPSIHPTEQINNHTITSISPKNGRRVSETSIRDQNENHSPSNSSMLEIKKADHPSDSEVTKRKASINDPKVPVPTEIKSLGESRPLHKAPSHDILDRPPRFEVQINSGSTSPMNYQSIPLSRDSSYSSAGNSNNSKSTYGTRYPHSELRDQSSSENIPISKEHGIKVGRFELTSNNEMRRSASNHNPQTNHSTLHLQSQIDELLRYNETQRALLHDLSLTVQQKRRGSISQESRHAPDELSHNIEHLETLIKNAMRENSLLQKENESLRKELKELTELKKQ